MPRLAETLLWLCNIPSPIGEEREICDRLEQRLSSAALAAPLRRYGDSLVVPLTRGHVAPHIVLGGHVDVVRTQHDAPPRIEGDRLYGPGASDMKSGLALMLDIAERRERPAVNLTLVFYAREEGPFADNELGVVLAKDAELTGVDLAVMLEPSDNKLQLGCGGSVHATLSFHGRTAHSSRPWQGENAIHKAAGFLARLAAEQPRPVELEGLSWNDVLSATLASGGRARNVVPDLFQLNLNHRFGPDTSLEASQERVRRFVGDDAEVEFVDLSPAAPPHRSNPLVRALMESGVPKVEAKLGWTDVARFAQLGVAAVNFGPGVQAQAHQKNEWTLLPALDEGAAIFDNWFRKIAPSPAPARG